MKKKRYYIKPIQSKGRTLPVTGFIVLWLLLDRVNAPEWLYAIYWFCAAVLFIFFWYDVFTVNENAVDIKKILKKEFEQQEREEKEN